MEEMLHQLIGSLSHYVQAFDRSQVVGRISAINSINPIKAYDTPEN